MGRIIKSLLESPSILSHTSLTEICNPSEAKRVLEVIEYIECEWLDEDWWGAVHLYIYSGMRLALGSLAFCKLLTNYAL